MQTPDVIKVTTKEEKLADMEAKWGIEIISKSFKNDVENQSRKRRVSERPKWSWEESGVVPSGEQRHEPEGQGGK